MKKYRLVRYLLLIVYVLPITYGHYKLLPDAAQYMVDLLLIIYIFHYSKIFFLRTSFSRIYLVFFFFILILTVLSLIIHHEGIGYFIPEFRRLFYPLVFYLILTDLFRSVPDVAPKIHKLIMIIFLVQIPVIIFQITTYSVVRSLGLFAKTRMPFIDVGSGTLGMAGHSFLGILIPLMIIYLYDLNRLKQGLIFVIPIVLINSGGGLALTVAVLGIIFIHSIFTGPINYRFKSLVSLGVLIGLLVLVSNLPIFKYSIDKYVGTYVNYTTNYLQGGRETWGENYDQIKISRFNGVSFLERKMDKFDYEQLFGLGFSFKENNGHSPYKYKNDLNFFLAERGYLGLYAYFIFMIGVLIHVHRVCVKRGYSKPFIKLLFFVTLFLGGIYNPTSRSFPVWLLVAYFLVLLENKEQYISLLKYLWNQQKAKKTPRKSFTRAPAYGVDKPEIQSYQ